MGAKSATCQELAIESTDDLGERDREKLRDLQAFLVWGGRGNAFFAGFLAPKIGQLASSLFF